MNDVLKKARTRLDEVLVHSAAILSAKTSNSYGYDNVDSMDFVEWRMSAKTILNLLDSTKEYRAEFERIYSAASYGGSAGKFASLAAVLRSFRDNFDGGYLSDIRGLVRAEVFSDLIEQAQHLFDEGYWQPVPVIVGAVLEDHLRKLCAKNPSIVLPSRPKLDTMNSELAKYREYGVLEQKQVTFWADVRNKAAHGHWKEFDEAVVAAMLRDVPPFLTKYPA